MIHVEFLRGHQHRGQTYVKGDIALVPLADGHQLTEEGITKQVISPLDRDLAGVLNFAISHFNRDRPGLCSIPDLFDNPDSCRLPETVYIVGAGPSALKLGLKIPLDACTIALNSSVMIDRPWSYWLVMDHNAAHLWWWRHANPPPETTRIFAWLVVKMMMMVPEYVKTTHFGFNNDPALPIFKTATKDRANAETPEGEDLLMPGRLRRGGSVLGAALQFAYWKGAKTIYLAGCEQQGAAHWDNTEDPKPRDVWSSMPKVAGLIHEMRDHGVQTYSLGATAIRGITCRPMPAA